MPEEKYSPGGLPEEVALPLDTFGRDQSGWGGRQRVSAPGRKRGDIKAGDLKALLHAVGSLDLQIDDQPLDGVEHKSRAKIVWDEFGRSYWCWKVYKQGRSVPEWYCLKGMRYDDPDFEIPSGGVIIFDGPGAGVVFDGDRDSTTKIDKDDDGNIRICVNGTCVLFTDAGIHLPSGTTITSDDPIPMSDDDVLEVAGSVLEEIGIMQLQLAEITGEEIGSQDTDEFWV